MGKCWSAAHIGMVIQHHSATDFGVIFSGGEIVCFLRQCRALRVLFEEGAG